MTRQSRRAAIDHYRQASGDLAAYDEQSAASGVTGETPEYLDLNDAAADARAATPWWIRQRWVNAGRRGGR